MKVKQQKLFGFGHRVYKNFDPRSQITTQLALEVAVAAGDDPLVQVALALQVRRVWFSLTVIHSLAVTLSQSLTEDDALSCAHLKLS